MEFWASSETYGTVGESVDLVRQIVEPLLKRLLANSRFAETPLTFRYVPIVMPADMVDRYPPRSKARLKQRVVECAPQLDYDRFVCGGLTDQVDEYLSGARTGASLLPKFGFSSADVGTFEAILVHAGTLALN